MPPYEKETKIDARVIEESNPPPSYDVYAKQIGPINPVGIPFVTDKSAYSAVQGFKKRIIPQTPTPSKRMLKAVKCTVHHMLKQMEPLPYLPWDDQFIEKYLIHYDKPQKVKEELREAYYDAVKNPLTPKDYELKSFLKREFYEDEKYARCIMVRSNRFKALCSYAIHLADEYLFHESPFARYFIKGMTPQEQVDAMAERFQGHNLFLETDYSSFESSFHESYQKVVEIAYWKHMLKNNPHILEIVLESYKKHTIYGKGYKGEMYGGRMSGDLWTSSMNGFSNLVNIMTLCRINNIEWDGFCEGDDGLFWLNSTKLTEADYAELGFVIKMEYKDRINDCSFCGKIFDEESKHVLGTPEQLNRIGWALDKSYWNAHLKSKQQLIYSRALSLACLYPGCPCIQARAKAILASADGHIKFTKRVLNEKYQLREMLKYHKDLDLDKLYHTLEFPEPTLKDRILYESRFGITISQQLEYEKKVTEDPWADVPLYNYDEHTGGKTNDLVIELPQSAVHV